MRFPLPSFGRVFSCTRQGKKRRKKRRKKRARTRKFFTENLSGGGFVASIYEPGAKGEFFFSFSFSSLFFYFLFFLVLAVEGGRGGGELGKTGD